MSLAFLNFLLFPFAFAIKKTLRGDVTHLIQGLSTQRRGRWPNWALSVSWACVPLHLPEEKQGAEGEPASAGGYLNKRPWSGGLALHRPALCPAAVSTQHDPGACVGVGG